MAKTKSVYKRKPGRPPKQKRPSDAPSYNIARDRCSYLEGDFPEAYLLYGKDWKIKGAAGDIIGLLGWTPKDLRGSSLPFVKKNEIKSVKADIEEYLKTPQNPIQITGVEKSGESVELMLSAAKLFKADRDDDGFVLVVRDADWQGKDCSATYAAATEIQLERKALELERTQDELHKAERNLQELHRTLDVLTKGYQESTHDLEDRIVSNYQITVLPVIEKLKELHPTGPEKFLLEALDVNIRNLSSNFGSSLVRNQIKLSARQMQICQMIRAGKDSKEIAMELGLSHQTVIVHRKNIRKKLGLKKNRQNLATYIKHNM
jgi:DNA-binding CsgD family transcriptional regulator